MAERLLKKQKFETELQARRVRALECFFNLMKTGRYTRLKTSQTAAAAHRFGMSYGAKNIRSWADRFETEQGALPMSNRDQHAKTFSLLNDPEHCEMLRAWVRQEKENMDPAKLAAYSQNVLIPSQLEKSVKEELHTEMPMRLKGYLEETFFPMLVKKPLPPETQPIVLVAHDESTCTANDGKKHCWILDGQAKLRKKGQGRGIHRSDFICSTYGWLEECGEQLEYGKNHEGFWTGEKMLKQVTEKFIPVFERLHPNQKALVLIDNSQGHNHFAADALRASDMNLRPGGKNARIMRDGWFMRDGQRIGQSMICPPDHPDAGKPKGMELVLKERGLWLEKASPDVDKLLITSTENCRYTFEGLKENMHAALKSVQLSTIRKFERRTHRWIQAYAEGKDVMQAGFQVHKYSSHRRVPEVAAATGEQEV
ncbi:hypothetical protein BT69DRAFT_1219788 [Atractiella rhizophila]|nr:hypothetical protein BT69DRAFT_1219788 [Atractiella rhizophila]